MRERGGGRRGGYGLRSTMFREPMHLCTSVSEERVHGEGTGSEASSLLAYCHGVSWHIATVSGKIPVLRYRGIYGAPMIFLGDQN